MTENVSPIEDRELRAITIALVAMLLVPLQAGDCERSSSFRPYPLSLVGSRPICIATFDVRHGRGYNEKNCAAAALLFRAQSGVAPRYLCEPVD